MNLSNLITTYKKHGFLVSRSKNFLLVSFKNSSKVSIIVHPSVSPSPLSFDDVKKLYEQLHKLGEKHNCFQYRIISEAGFEEDTYIFNDLNVALSGKDYMDSLQSINHIELYAHNDIAYNKLVKEIEHSSKACIIQPTGTGKSLILSKFITEKSESKFVFLSPSKFIVGEVKKHLFSFQNTEFFTYSKVTFLTVKEIQHLNPNFIIVDEFHRCGAEEWGSGVDLLLKTYPEAKLIGTTATHIRYLDNKRNMADELFEGNIAHHLTLSKALALNILPVPKYVSALYKFSEEYSRVKKSILSSMAEDKKVILERLNKIKLEFENTNSIPHILEEHLTEDIQKIIVFTKDIKHLRKHKPMVLDWFNSIGYKNISVYEVHSENDQKNNKIFKNFESNQNGIDIMFSVNMLNEGIHVKGVNCIIMLRDTESPIIYYQQLGRCLTVGADKPLILDFVNNFANIRHRDFENEVGNESKKLFEIFRYKGIPYQEISFEIIDKTRDIKSLLEDVEISSDSWNVFLKKAKEYFEKNGHLTISENYPDQWFFNKLKQIRRSYLKGSLNQEQIKQLEPIGFNFNPKNALIDEEILSKLSEYKKIHGHFKILKNYQDKKLYYKVNYIKHSYRKGTLSQKHIKQLESIGFDFYPKKPLVDKETFAKLLEFKKIHGHLKIPRNYTDESLYNKVTHIRCSYRKGTLSQEQIKQLESIGFDFNPEKYLIEEKTITRLLEFKKIHGHLKIPTNDPDQSLYKKAICIRRSYHRGTLNQEQIKQLESIGFDFNPRKLHKTS